MMSGNIKMPGIIVNKDGSMNFGSEVNKLMREYEMSSSRRVISPEERKITSSKSEKPNFGPEVDKLMKSYTTQESQFKSRRIPGL